MPFENLITGTGLPAVGGLGGLGGLGGFDPGNALGAIGMALLSSPRNNPLQNLPHFVGEANKRAEAAYRAKAMEQALVSAGIPRAEAQVIARNPEAAKVRLDTLERDRRLKSSQMADDEMSRIYSGGDAVPPSVSGVEPRADTPAKPPQQFGRLFSHTEEQYGLPSGYLARTASIESRFNPSARNKSGASGLFQFMPETAADYGLSNPLDPVASTDAAARLAATNARQLRAVLGREPTAGELYLAHQQGSAGAAALLSNPDASALEALTQAHGNRTRAYRAITANGGSPGMRAGDFAAMWTGKFGNDAAEADLPIRGGRAAQFDANADSGGSAQPLAAWPTLPGSVAILPAGRFSERPAAPPYADNEAEVQALEHQTGMLPKRDDTAPLPRLRPAGLGNGAAILTPPPAMNIDPNSVDAGAKAFASAGMGRAAPRDLPGMGQPSRPIAGPGAADLPVEHGSNAAAQDGFYIPGTDPRSRVDGSGRPVLAPPPPMSLGGASPVRHVAQSPGGEMVPGVPQFRDAASAQKAIPRLFRLLALPNLDTGARQAVHTALQDALAVAKPTERARQLMEAGYTPGTKEYVQAYRQLINSERTPRGFELDPDNPGQLRPIKGGPHDPAAQGLSAAPTGYRWVEGGQRLEAIPGGPAANKGVNRPLPHNAVKDLSEAGASYGDYKRLVGGFQDKFAGYGSQTAGDVANWAGRNLPGVTDERRLQAEWWQDYQSKKNVVRNNLFGSALTATEKSEFEKADINPGMAPGVIRKNLARQQAAAERAARKLAGYYVKSGRNPEEIEAALGVPLEELGLGGGSAETGSRTDPPGRAAPRLPVGGSTTIDGLSIRRVQ